MKFLGALLPLLVWSTEAGRPRGGAWDDVSRYGPATLEPGCPVEVRQCMIGIHTNAGECLGIMRDAGIKQRQGNCPEKRAASGQWWKASAAWHDALRSCLAGEAPPTVVPIQPTGFVYNKTTSGYGIQALADCWAERRVYKKNCLDLMKANCPRMTACMGMGPEPFNDPDLRQWYNVVKGLREDKDRKQQAMSNIIEQCVANNSGK